MTRSRHTFGTWLWVVVTLLLPTDTAWAETEELVDYFSSKDETCYMDVTPQDQPYEIMVKLERLLFVVDYYGAGDTELWCTLVVVPNAAAESQALRFSASNPPCGQILDAELRRLLRLTVFKDHVCDLEFVDDPVE